MDRRRPLRRRGDVSPTGMSDEEQQILTTSVSPSNEAEFIDIENIVKLRGSSLDESTGDVDQDFGDVQGGIDPFTALTSNVSDAAKRKVLSPGGREIGRRKMQKTGTCTRADVVRSHQVDTWVQGKDADSSDTSSDESESGGFMAGGKSTSYELLTGHRTSRRDDNNSPPAQKIMSPGSPRRTETTASSSKAGHNMLFMGILDQAQLHMSKDFEDDDKWDDDDGGSVELVDGDQDLDLPVYTPRARHTVHSDHYDLTGQLSPVSYRRVHSDNTQYDRSSSHLSPLSPLAISSPLTSPTAGLDRHQGIEGKLAYGRALAAAAARQRDISYNSDDSAPLTTIEELEEFDYKSSSESISHSDPDNKSSSTQIADTDNVPPSPPHPGGVYKPEVYRDVDRAKVYTKTEQGARDDIRDGWSIRDRADYVNERGNRVDVSDQQVAGNRIDVLCEQQTRYGVDSNEREGRNVVDRNIVDRNIVDVAATQDVSVDQSGGGHSRVAQREPRPSYQHLSYQPDNLPINSQQAYQQKQPYKTRPEDEVPLQNRHGSQKWDSAKIHRAIALTPSGADWDKSMSTRPAGSSPRSPHIEAGAVCADIDAGAPCRDRYEVSNSAAVAGAAERPRLAGNISRHAFDTEGREAVKSDISDSAVRPQPDKRLSGIQHPPSSLSTPGVKPGLILQHQTLTGPTEHVSGRVQPKPDGQRYRPTLTKPKPFRCSLPKLSRQTHREENMEQTGECRQNVNVPEGDGSTGTQSSQSTSDSSVSISDSPSTVVDAENIQGSATQQTQEQDVSSAITNRPTDGQGDKNTAQPARSITGFRDNTQSEQRDRHSVLSKLDQSDQNKYTDCVTKTTRADVGSAGYSDQSVDGSTARDEADMKDIEDDSVHGRHIDEVMRQGVQKMDTSTEEGVHKMDTSTLDQMYSKQQDVTGISSIQKRDISATSRRDAADSASNVRPAGDEALSDAMEPSAAKKPRNIATSPGITPSASLAAGQERQRHGATEEHSVTDPSAERSGHQDVDRVGEGVEDKIPGSQTSREEVVKAVKTLRMKSDDSQVQRRSRPHSFHGDQLQSSGHSIPPRRHYDWNTHHFYPDIHDVDGRSGKPLVRRMTTRGSHYNQYVDEQWIHDLYHYDQVDTHKSMSDMSVKPAVQDDITPHILKSKSDDKSDVCRRENQENVPPPHPSHITHIKAKSNTKTESLSVDKQELQLDLSYIDSSSDQCDGSPQTWHKNPLLVKRTKRRRDRPVSAEIYYTPSNSPASQTHQTWQDDSGSPRLKSKDEVVKKNRRSPRRLSAPSNFGTSSPRTTPRSAGSTPRRNSDLIQEKLDKFAELQKKRQDLESTSEESVNNSHYSQRKQNTIQEQFQHALRPTRGRTSGEISPFTRLTPQHGRKATMHDDQQEYEGSKKHITHSQDDVRKTESKNLAEPITTVHKESHRHGASQHEFIKLQSTPAHVEQPKPHPVKTEVDYRGYLNSHSNKSPANIGKSQMDFRKVEEGLTHSIPDGKFYTPEYDNQTPLSKPRNISSSFENIYDGIDLSTHLSLMDKINPAEFKRMCENDPKIFDHIRMMHKEISKNSSDPTEVKPQAGSSSLVSSKDVEMDNRQRGYTDTSYKPLKRSSHPGKIIIPDADNYHNRSNLPPLNNMSPPSSTSQQSDSWYAQKSFQEQEPQSPTKKMDAKMLIEEEQRKFADYKAEYKRKKSEKESTSGTSGDEIKESGDDSNPKMIPPDEYDYILRKFHHQRQDAIYETATPSDHSRTHSISSTVSHTSGYEPSHDQYLREMKERKNVHLMHRGKSKQTYLTDDALPPVFDDQMQQKNKHLDARNVNHLYHTPSLSGSSISNIDNSLHSHLNPDGQRTQKKYFPSPMHSMSLDSLERSDLSTASEKQSVPLTSRSSDMPKSKYFPSPFTNVIQNKEEKPIPKTGPQHRYHLNPLHNTDTVQAQSMPSLIPAVEKYGPREGKYMSSSLMQPNKKHDEDDSPRGPSAYDAPISSSAKDISVHKAQQPQVQRRHFSPSVTQSYQPDNKQQPSDARRERESKLYHRRSWDPDNYQSSHHQFVTKTPGESQTPYRVAQVNNTEQWDCAKEVFENKEKENMPKQHTTEFAGMVHGQEMRNFHPSSGVASREQWNSQQGIANRKEQTQYHDAGKDLAGGQEEKQFHPEHGYRVLSEHENHVSSGSPRHILNKKPDSNEFIHTDRQSEQIIPNKYYQKPMKDVARPEDLRSRDRRPIYEQSYGTLEESGFFRPIATYPPSPRSSRHDISTMQDNNEFHYEDPLQPTVKPYDGHINMTADHSVPYENRESFRPYKSSTNINDTHDLQIPKLKTSNPVEGKVHPMKQQVHHSSPNVSYDYGSKIEARQPSTPDYYQIRNDHISEQPQVNNKHESENTLLSNDKQGMNYPNYNKKATMYNNHNLRDEISPQMISYQNRGNQSYIFDRKQTHNQNVSTHPQMSAIEYDQYNDVAETAKPYPVEIMSHMPNIKDEQRNISNKKPPTPKRDNQISKPKDWQYSTAYASHDGEYDCMTNRMIEEENRKNRQHKTSENKAMASRKCTELSDSKLSREQLQSSDTPYLTYEDKVKSYCEDHRQSQATAQYEKYVQKSQARYRDLKSKNSNREDARGKIPLRRSKSLPRDSSNSMKDRCNNQPSFDIQVTLKRSASQATENRPTGFVLRMSKSEDDLRSCHTGSDEMPRVSIKSIKDKLYGNAGELPDSKKETELVNVWDRRDRKVSKIAGDVFNMTDQSLPEYDKPVPPSSQQFGEEEDVRLSDYISYKDGYRRKTTTIDDVLTDLEQTYENLQLDSDEWSKDVERTDHTERPIRPYTPVEHREGMVNVKRLSITNLKKLEEIQMSVENPSLEYAKRWLSTGNSSEVLGEDSVHQVSTTYPINHSESQSLTSELRIRDNTSSLPRKIADDMAVRKIQPYPPSVSGSAAHLGSYLAQSLGGAQSPSLDRRSMSTHQAADGVYDDIPYRTVQRCKSPGGSEKSSALLGAPSPTSTDYLKERTTEPGRGRMRVRADYDADKYHDDMAYRKLRKDVNPISASLPDAYYEMMHGSQNPHRRSLSLERITHRKQADHTRPTSLQRSNSVGPSEKRRSVEKGVAHILEVFNNSLDNSQSAPDLLDKSAFAEKYDDQGDLVSDDPKYCKVSSKSKKQQTPRTVKQRHELKSRLKLMKSSADSGYLESESDSHSSSGPDLHYNRTTPDGAFESDDPDHSKHCDSTLRIPPCYVDMHVKTENIGHNSIIDPQVSSPNSSAQPLRADSSVDKNKSQTQRQSLEHQHKQEQHNQTEQKLVTAVISPLSSHTSDNQFPKYSKQVVNQSIPVQQSRVVQGLPKQSMAVQSFTQQSMAVKDLTRQNVKSESMAVPVLRRQNVGTESISDAVTNSDISAGAKVNDEGETKVEPRKPIFKIPEKLRQSMAAASSAIVPATLVSRDSEMIKRTQADETKVTKIDKLTKRGPGTWESEIEKETVIEQPNMRSVHQNRAKTTMEHHTMQDDKCKMSVVRERTEVKHVGKIRMTVVEGQTEPMLRLSGAHQHPSLHVPWPIKSSPSPTHTPQSRMSHRMRHSPFSPADLSDGEMTDATDITLDNLVRTNMGRPSSRETLDMSCDWDRVSDKASSDGSQKAITNYIADKKLQSSAKTMHTFHEVSINDDGRNKTDSFSSSQACVIDTNKTEGGKKVERTPSFKELLRSFEDKTNFGIKVSLFKQPSAEDLRSDGSADTRPPRPTSRKNFREVWGSDPNLHTSSGRQVSESDSKRYVDPGSPRWRRY